MEYNDQASTYLFPRTAFYVQTGEGEGLWMNENPADNVSEEFKGKTESVRGPSQGAPIGSSVHNIANAVDPYAAQKTVGEPDRGVQHQPFLFGDDERKAANAAAGAAVNKGVTAKDAGEAKTIATGPVIIKKSLA